MAISAASLKDYVNKILLAEGVEATCARDVAEVLIDAECTGVVTHGVSRLANYVKRLRAGLVSPDNNIRIVQESPSTLVIDAGNSFGAPATRFAMEACIERAKQSGACFATVNHSNHFGAAAYYTKLAAKEGMIGFLCTNLTPKIAPHGARSAYIGTNPICLAAPTTGDPFVLDMTPSVVALGKLITAQQLGKEIPLGWALDADGNPTTDPAAGRAGSLVPIGGPKGSGLAMAVEILAGVLSGAGTAPQLHDLYAMDAPQGIGHFLGVIDVARFMDPAVFAEALSRYFDEIRHLEKVEGTKEIRIPGERGFQVAKEVAQKGIEIPDAVCEELRALGDAHAIPFPDSL